jgi:solute carrier family 10 (sodium/bile acid cotransporter), member 7
MPSLFPLLKKAGLNNFFFLLIGMILLAKLFPEWGTSESLVPIKSITSIGISIIFFFYGVKLDPHQLKAGLFNWKLHLVIQMTTFLIFPLLILLAYSIFGTTGSLIWMGTFYLAALPSTVSSSVVMVSIAKGNMMAAIFNASLSSIIGIYLTPLWMEVMLPASEVQFDLSATFLQLTMQILIPVIGGLFFHKLLIKWVKKFQTSLKNFDQVIILLIVFNAFAESFAENMFANKTLIELLILGVLMLMFFLVMMGLMHIVSKFLGFSDADRIAVLFCGSKKSLVQGAVMGRVMFPDPTVLGVILLPLMIYHALQLMAGSAIAQRMGTVQQNKSI